MVMRLALTFLLLIGGFALSTPPAQAQQSSEPDVVTPAGDPNAPQKPAKKSKTAAAKPAATASTGSDVDQRLQQLEEQVSDMQVTLGTVESLGKTRPASAPGAALTGGDVDVRVGRLEAQLQGLSAQINEIANHMRVLEQRLQGDGGAKIVPLTHGQNPAPLTDKQGGLGTALGEQPAAADTGFGQTTVAKGGAAGSDESAMLDAPAGAAGGSDAQAAAVPPLSNDPQAAYDQAYAFILQQDYAGAESAFRDYIGRFPQSPLASNANYWLGQSYYARGQYKPAADAFLKGYKSYRTGQKAPDSLLKVAMSLSRLGQKDMACSALTALDGEFPNASVQVKHLAQTERERSGC